MEKHRLEISQARQEDAQTILALQKAAYLSEARIYGDMTLPPLVQTLTEMVTDIRTMTVLKAVLNGTITGSVRARQEGGCCRIGRLIVTPDLQGQGIGTSLMTAVEAAFPAVKIFELFTGDQSLKNLTFYRKLGYRPVRTETLSANLTLVFMTKPGPGK